jgi:hypothetical protein
MPVCRMSAMIRLSLQTMKIFRENFEFRDNTVFSDIPQKMRNLKRASPLIEISVIGK